MPIKECQIGGVKGYKWGDEGTCYTGRDAKQKAIRQAIAISKDIGEGIELQETYNDYPKEARENAKRVLDWIEKYGRDMVKAGTLVGLARARQLANGEGISLDTIKRMAAFNRHRENSEIDPKYKGKPYLDRGYTAWLMWGGTAGVDWAIRKLKQIENQ